MSDTIEQATRVLSRAWGNMHTNESLGHQRMLAGALADAGLLAQPTPTRKQIAMAIAARHWDRDSGDVEVWHDLTPGEREAIAENYLTWDSADAVLALLKGQKA